MLAASRSVAASVQQHMHPLSTHAHSHSWRVAHRGAPLTYAITRSSPLEAGVVRFAVQCSQRSHPLRVGLAQCRSTDGAAAACSQPEQLGCGQERAPGGDAPRSLHPHVAKVVSALAVALQQLRCFRTYLRTQQPGLCLGAAAVVPLTSRGLVDQLTGNYVFVVGFWAWFAAQFAKIFTKRIREGVWDVTAVIDSGGMPSSHSSLCMAVTTAVGHKLGLGSPIFAVALAFSLIVMYDAANVRWHAGKQAEVLNIVMADLLEGHPISEKKMKEVLGHTPVQVAAGAVLGVLVGVFYPTPLSAFPS